MTTSRTTNTAAGKRSLLAAGLLGAASGMRTMTPPAALAASGRVRAPRPVTAALLLAAAGELVGDKLPNTPARTMPIAFVGRVATGAICGWVVRGPVGAALGSAAAAATTVVGHDLRAAAVKRSGLPDLPFALLEDVIAISTATYAATR